ncbi:TatD family hydrolase [Robertkochia solimangrovi]|uniref:TatD family hydrolase n=1 Tax=Robertkochia solimangrovi TaxID=2213046 RepID=UPI0011800F59|nr:TatD family hydrolase [Robertkochia solimangrovi]TRZ46360.1 hydrolase TatD [Robertkochia solimangrovi]
MILTDTHTHLYSEAFEEDRDTMIQRALDLNIKRFFIPAIDSTYVASMYALEEAYPEHVFLMAGLHPTHVKENYREELDLIRKQLETRKFVAIGEIGIDLYWDKTFLKEQQEAFREQIRIAKSYDLPIVIHCRDAFEEVFDILESEKDAKLRGIFHCFTGNEEQAHRAISYNMLLGIGGVVTFKNGKIDQFLGNIDTKHIVLETDSPYLAPAPFRGKRNETAYLTYVLDKLAGIYQLTPEELAAITTENSRLVFGV